MFVRKASRSYIITSNAANSRPLDDSTHELEVHCYSFLVAYTDYLILILLLYDILMFLWRMDYKSSPLMRGSKVNLDKKKNNDTT